MLSVKKWSKKDGLHNFITLKKAVQSNIKEVKIFYW